MQHVIDAIAATLDVSRDIAARIHRENSMTLAWKTIPAEVLAIGYAGNHGHHLMLADADHDVICELRVSAGAIEDIDRHRRTVAPGTTVMTDDERRMADLLLDALRDVDPSAMISFDDGRFLYVDGCFDMGRLVRTLTRSGMTLPGSPTSVRN